MKTARDNAEKIKEISGANPQKCMKCGKCSATCPAFNEMDIKPHQFVSYVAEENIVEMSFLLRMCRKMSKRCKTWKTD